MSSSHGNGKCSQNGKAQEKHQLAGKGSRVEEEGSRGRLAEEMWYSMQAYEINVFCQMKNRPVSAKE